MNAETIFSAASKHYQKRDYMGALEALNQLLGVQQDGKTFDLLAKTLVGVGMKAEAATAYQNAAKVEPEQADGFLRKAMNLFLEAGEDDKALLIAKNFMGVAKEDAEVAFVLASIFVKRGQKQIVAPLRGALIDSADPRHVLFSLHFMTGDMENADDERTARAVLKHFPHRNDLRFHLQMILRDRCDFEGMRKNFAPIEAELKRGNLKVLNQEQPLSNVFWCGNEKQNKHATATTPAFTGEERARRRQMAHTWRDDKLRIGYLSADFWPGHATMKLLQDVLKRHDRERFEVTLFCHTPPQKIAESGFDRSVWGDIVTVTHLSDGEAAETIRARNIDILVDLKGHNKDNRSRLLNLGLAPVQVTWLGFPGAVTNVDIDYAIGDRFVLPESSAPHYLEKFCRMPESYQPNDPVSRPPPRHVSRTLAQLPEGPFVYSSFNGVRKITSHMVDLWSRILKGAPDSVFWLMAPYEKQRANLAKAFAERGVDPARIIFAPTIVYEMHIARMATADLMLDAYPCNGHTTTSEALWSGLPVLTYKGTNFASRVSESLLNAAGLPDLVADNDKAYVDLAIALGNDRERMAGIRKRLIDNRFIQPLFDSERFCRHLETAYAMMADRAKAGLEPDHFDVPALPPRTEAFGSL
ncbi:glycosyl transferase [Ciceribacter sp. L1K23]|uniref:O-linked N-acetylglucosamine transferase, SPINDLY family protein n=1 Tax=Ciceribacter sp. L1K23 TaxID=2820276 RepID=UPI001B8323F6|nr:glycosyl transferase [Ciceribacter sp. L1K23]MBR0556434.1 glycosyl transferase [Ciceribacter sp. L1K23]